MTSQASKMTDWGPWEDQLRGKKMLNTEGPFERFQARVNPDREFNNIDRAWRQKWLKVSSRSKERPGPVSRFQL